MADHIRVTMGYPPWEPAPGAHLVTVLHRFTDPLIGVIERDDGCHYLFWCLFGQASRVNVWAYALVSKDDVKGLSSLTRDQLVESLRSITRERGTVVAFAGEDSGILLGRPVDPPISFGDPMEKLMTTVSKVMDEITADFELVRHETEPIHA